MMATETELSSDGEVRDQILKRSDPKQIKALSRKVRGFSQRVWDRLRYIIVLGGNWCKSSQNHDLQGFLPSTKNSVLMEAGSYNSIRDIRPSSSSPGTQDPMKWWGQGLLGFALMEVRDEPRRVMQNEALYDWSTVWQK